MVFYSIWAYHQSNCHDNVSINPRDRNKLQIVVWSPLTSLFRPLQFIYCPYQLKSIAIKWKIEWNTYLFIPSLELLRGKTIPQIIYTFYTLNKYTHIIKSYTYIKAIWVQYALFLIPCSCRCISDLHRINGHVIFRLEISINTRRTNKSLDGISYSGTSMCNSYRTHLAHVTSASDFSRPSVAML